MNKPTYVKPGLYTIFYEQLKLIAKEYGYNLLVNGSMNRDLDMVAVPWVDKPRPEQKMIKEFQMYMTGISTVDIKGNMPYSVLPGNRHVYDIQLNRGDRHGAWVRFADEQYYLDISVVQLTQKEKK